VLQGQWPPTALLAWLGLPPALALVRLLGRYHDEPSRIAGSKFLALKFQGVNGLGLAAGLALGHWL
jgi:1,4-dihydroxy-2-naphthoate octaprenyltransferase